VTAVVAGVARLGAGWWLPLHLFVVAGTPPYFTATQMRSKMPPRAVAAAMRITFLALAAATALAATGAILDRSDVVAVGLISYALGLVVVAAILPIDTTRRLRRGGPRVDTNVLRPGWRSPIFAVSLAAGNTAAAGFAALAGHGPTPRRRVRSPAAEARRRSMERMRDLGGRCKPSLSLCPCARRMV
jgi:hypothetical protein